MFTPHACTHWNPSPQGQESLPAGLVDRSNRSPAQGSLAGMGTGAASGPRAGRSEWLLMGVANALCQSQYLTCSLVTLSGQPSMCMLALSCSPSSSSPSASPERGQMGLQVSEVCHHNQVLSTTCRPLPDLSSQPQGHLTFKTNSLPR